MRHSRSEAKTSDVQPLVPMRPDTTLEEAQRICDSSRNAAYGEPLDNHQATADLYNAYFNGRRNAGLFFMGPEEVCVLNILQKIGRTINGGYSRDTIVDIEGYAYNIEKVQRERDYRAVEAAR